MSAIPPFANDLEQAVLGAIILESNAFTEIESLLTYKSFYKHEHQLIFKACEDLAVKSKPIDMLTVTEQLMNSGNLENIGGPYYLTELMQRIGSSNNIKHHALIIREKEILREVIKLTQDAKAKAFEPTTDAFDLINELETTIASLNNLEAIQEATSAKDGLIQLIKEYESPENGAGIFSGLTDFDNLFNGFYGGNLIILAARPSMGKTAFALEIAKHTAANQTPIAFFSLEMGKVELMQRLTANIESIPLSGIKKKNLNHELFAKMVKSNVADMPIYIDDTFSLTVGQIKSKATRLKKEYNIGAVFIDYLQLIKPPDRYKGNKTQEIGYISRALKGIAKELNVPVICLSQLNRGVESRSIKKPLLSDLRESGDIEQDADVVMFLYRHEYYYPDETDLSDKGKTEIIVAKNRSGELSIIECYFNGNYQKFSENNIEQTPF